MASWLGHQGDTNFQFWVRFWCKFEDEFYAVAPLGNFLRIQTSNSGVSGLELCFNLLEGSDPDGTLWNCDLYSNPGFELRNFSPFSFGDWHKFDIWIGYYTSGGWVRIWVDKTTFTQPTSVAYETWNVGAGAFDHVRLPFYNKRQGTGQMWLDDVQIWDGMPSTQPDTQVPTVPTSLSGSAISSGQINLSWTSSTDNVGVTGYKIYRCFGSGCTPSTQIGTATTNSYSNTGLIANTTYVYRVTAYDAAGNTSGQSTSATATTQAPPDTTPPAPPTGVTVI